jgi:hypothetical protein
MPKPGYAKFFVLNAKRGEESFEYSDDVFSSGEVFC